MRVREFLADLIGGLYGMAHAEARRRSDEVLAHVGLEEAADRRIGGFSRGMRQRLGLAQALMNQPRVLLLDEPVSALDPGGRHDILTLIGQLAKQTTIFMSTHILGDVERICDVIGILDHGRLIALDTRENLLSRYATPAIEVTFDAEPKAVNRWAESLSQLSMIQDIKLDGSSVRVTLDGQPQSEIEMQRVALGAELTILTYQHIRPQLEDVFLRLVR
jgi:ABC-2 type transport system ATP-binding protein